VANYGLGGQYATHHDSSGFFEFSAREDLKFGPQMIQKGVEVGDRVATFMAYLR